MAGVLAWYGDFFDLFGDFGGYVDHFLLNDLVESGYAAVRFFKEFDDFAGDPLRQRALRSTASTCGGRCSSSGREMVESTTTPLLSFDPDLT